MKTIFKTVAAASVLLISMVGAVPANAAVSDDALTPNELTMAKLITKEMNTMYGVVAKEAKQFTMAAQKVAKAEGLDSPSDYKKALSRYNTKGVLSLANKWGKFDMLTLKTSSYMYKMSSGRPAYRKFNTLNLGKMVFRFDGKATKKDVYKCRDTIKSASKEMRYAISTSNDEIIARIGDVVKEYKAEPGITSNILAFDVINAADYQAVEWVYNLNTEGGYAAWMLDACGFTNK